MDKETLIAQLSENHNSFITYIHSLNESDFMKSDHGKWTAGQQLDHIYRSVKPLVLAFTLPPFIVRLLFGKAKRSSKTYEEIVRKYENSLENGGKATGAFIPKAIKFEQRTVLINSLKTVILKLRNRLFLYNEEQLDNILLPHPLLGKLTAREMLYFTVYHVQLHNDITSRNLSQAV